MTTRTVKVARLKKIIWYVATYYLIASVAFGWGLATIYFQIFPFAQIRSIQNEIEAFILQNHHESSLDILRLDHQEIRSNRKYSGLTYVDKGFSDDGFLLVSRYSKVYSQTIVELLDLSSSRVLHTWIPNLEEIFSLTPDYTTGINTRMAYRSQHPLLLPKGDLVIGSGEGPLVRIDSCSRLQWIINRHFHHSIEQDSIGNIVAPIVGQWRKYPDDLYVRDDSVAVISPEGKILSEHSIHDALLVSGYQGLVFGVGNFEDDRYHLNDVQPLIDRNASDGVLLSLRHLSSVVFFVPKTGEIRWLKTGPWLNQHDINDLGDGRYSVFGNNNVRPTGKFLAGYSEIYIFSPTSGEIETPYSEVLKEVQMKTNSGGRVTILNNGDAFVEETSGQRLMRISSNKVRWKYINVISGESDTEKTVSSIHWSRYLPRGSFDTEWIGRQSCE